MRNILFLVMLVSVLLVNKIKAQSQGSLQDAFDKYLKKDFITSIKILDRILTENKKNDYAFYLRGLAKYEVYGKDSCINDLKKSESLGNPYSAQILKNFEYSDVPMLEQDLKKIWKQKGGPSYDRMKFTQKDSLRGALRPQRTCFDVTHYGLDINIFPSSQSIKGSVEVSFKMNESSNEIQLDLFQRYKISGIIFNGKKLSYKRKFDAVFVKFPQDLEKGKAYKLKVFYQGTPQVALNPPWEGGFVWSKDAEGNDWIGVACENLGASSWWPNKDHLSDEPDSVSIKLTVPLEYTAISNGKLTSMNEDDKNSSYSWTVHNTINNYNITFYIGKFQEFEYEFESLGRKRTVQFYVLPYHFEKAKNYFEQTKDVIAFYEKVFGEYEFWEDKFCLVESPYAGMEHQSAIAYGADFETNNIYRNKKYDYIIVHECAHEWWGNSVSCGDMADGWIHEGFATYAEYLFIEHQFNYQEYLYEVVESRKRIHNMYQIVGPRDVNANTLIDGDAYTKGANMLHNLRCLINDDSAFFSMIKEFYQTHANSIVTTKDFTDFANKKFNRNLDPFFKAWLYQKSVPELEYYTTTSGSDIILKFRWVNVPPGFQMPFGVLKNENEGIRVMGTDQLSEIKLNGNIRIPCGWEPGYELLPKNSFTYFKRSVNH